MALCKFCDASIDFEKNKWDRWITIDPGTGRRHECQLQQRCQVCNKPFMGAPYKKKCLDCYKDNQPGREGFRKPNNSETGNFGEPTRHVKMERVRMPAGHDDDNFGEDPGQKKNDDYYDDIPF